MKLNAKQIAALPKEYFGLPKEKRYPMPDKEHVLKAIQFFGYCKKSEQKELADNINRRARELKVTVKVSPKNPFFKFVDKFNVLKENGEYVAEFHMGSISPIVTPSGEVQEKPYIKRISDILESDDDCIDEIKDLFTKKENKDLKESFNTPYTGWLQQKHPAMSLEERDYVKPETLGNIEIDYKDLMYNMAVNLEKNKMIDKYNNNALHHHSNELMYELIGIIKSEMNKSERDNDTILSILNVLINNKPYLLYALSYIGFIDSDYLNEIVQKLNIQGNDIPYLPKSVNVSNRLGTPDVFFNTTVPDEGVPYSYNFTESEMLYCDAFNCNDNTLGLRFVNGISEFFKNMGYKEPQPAFDLNTNDRPAFRLKINNLVKKLFLDGYYIFNNNSYGFFVKLKEQTNFIYYGQILKDNKNDDVLCLVLVHDIKNDNLYHTLCNDILNSIAFKINYRIFSFNDTKVCNESMIDGLRKVSNFLKRISINKDGDIQINLTSESTNHMDIYDKIHQYITINKKSENMDGLKSNLADLFTLINDIETNYRYNKKADKTTDEYKNAIKARAFAINDFKQTLKYILKKDFKFNFVKYYEAHRERQDSIIISREKIKSVAALFKLIMV